MNLVFFFFIIIPLWVSIFIKFIKLFYEIPNSIPIKK